MFHFIYHKISKLIANKKQRQFIKHEPIIEWMVWNWKKKKVFEKLQIFSLENSTWKRATPTATFQATTRPNSRPIELLEARPGRKISTETGARLVTLVAEVVRAWRASWKTRSRPTARSSRLFSRGRPQLAPPRAQVSEKTRWTKRAGLNQWEAFWTMNTCMTRSEGIPRKRNRREAKSLQMWVEWMEGEMFFFWSNFWVGLVFGFLIFWLHKLTVIFPEFHIEN